MIVVRIYRYDDHAMLTSGVRDQHRGESPQDDAQRDIESTVGLQS